MKKKRGRPTGIPYNYEWPPWRVHTADAAKELGISPQTVIWKMEHGMLPIGDVVRKSQFGGCETYIFRKLLDEYKESRGITT